LNQKQASELSIYGSPPAADANSPAPRDIANSGSPAGFDRDSQRLGLPFPLHD
jgi:hypothetical protein